MELVVHCHGPARHAAGSDSLTVEVADDPTVGDVVDALAAQGGALAELLPRCAVAVGDELVPRTRRVRPGDELALLPPVAGG